MKKEKGATLLELLIYIAVLFLIFVVVGETFTTIILTKKKIEARREVSRNIDFAVQKIEQSIKSASSVNYTYPSNNLSLTVGGEVVSFGLSSGILQKTIGAETYDITSEKVTVSAGGEYMFYKIENPLTNPTVQIKIKISYNSNDSQLQNVESYIQTTVSLR